MKRFLIATLVVTLGFSVASPVHAKRVARRAPQPVVVEKGARRTVVVYRGWPVRRPLHTVVIRRPGAVVRVTPVRYLPLVVWTPVIVASAPPADVLVWQDSEALDRDEDWTEITLNSDSRGRKLYLRVVEGRVQLDFAEVVFENGETRVIDMGEKTRDPGLYVLLGFADGRKVDHVRLVARARTPTAKISLLMER